MWKLDKGTPCPSNNALANHTDIFSPIVDCRKQKSEPVANHNGNVNTNLLEGVFDDYNDDDDNTTRNIAKLMRDEFRMSRVGIAQKPRKRVSNVAVFDDQESQRVEKNGSGLMGGGAIKARRPQKIKLETVREDRLLDASLLLETSGAGGRDAMVAGGDEGRYEGGHAANDENVASRAPAKIDRRRTIWVPSDDTTVMSIHPGNYDQTLRDDTICLPPQKGLAHTKAPRSAVMSSHVGSLRQSMSVAPKRAPLKSLAPVQPNTILKDRSKCRIGKENIPPGTWVKSGFEMNSHEPGTKPIKSVVQPLEKPLQATRTSLLREQTASFQAKAALYKKRSAPEPKEEPARVKATLIKDPRVRPTAEHKPSSQLRDHIANARAQKNPSSLERQASVNLTAPVFQPQINANLSRYPVLTDDLVQPELYEDNWLSHQEVALTQLINSVFEQAKHANTFNQDESGLRKKLLYLYQDSQVVAMHKKIKASLIYGALSMPRDKKEPPRLREDVGLRRQFLDLWVQSYSLDALQAAAEVVVGRTVSSKPRDAASVAQSLGSAGGNVASAKERELRRFLLAFLVHHEDAIDANAQQPRGNRGSDPAAELILSVGSSEWFWHRTVLHSLMLVLLLDSAKTSGVVHGCLFQASSIRKSSNSILHALTRMLLPWIGDVTRPLGYMDFGVAHVQLPLAEYDYRIDNLATDLRDGVLLTRFVELLVYPDSSMSSDSNQTLTLSLPDGETLTSILAAKDQSETWPLSQHLKFPCVGRAQKLHNVHVALSALDTVRSSGVTSAAIASTTANDIVDGHREKTLSLLWSLVSKWGLGLLIDWDELKRETQRFAADETAFDPHLFLDEDVNDAHTPDNHEQATLLKNWVTAICALSGITVTNLTTSFADGRALSCVVDAYIEYLPSATTTAKSTTLRRAHPTAAALQTLGCSESFIALFASTTSIPCRSTTVALLAFLASRLLPLARSHRAAKTVQRTWRLVMARRTITRRVKCAVLARQCAEIVALKAEFEGAAVVLQRAWRGVCERRAKREWEDVVGLQRLVRGWAVRRRVVAGSLLSKKGGVGRRVMGGW